MKRRVWLMPVVFAGLMLSLGAFAQKPGKIDISKMNPAGLLVDKYSYMAQPYSFYYFHHMDQLGLRTDLIKKGERIYPLREPARDWTTDYKFHGGRYSLNEYFKRNFVTGFLVLHNDQIIVERYFHEADRNSRFVSQSLSKSIVSILVGAAVEEGAIKSVEDPVTKYLPYLSEGGYRNVTVKNLLQMSTGVNYSENYRDPKSGAALIGAALLTGNPSFKDYVQSIQPTRTAPGTKFEYQSVNTQVLGLLLEKVTGKRLNTYAQEKLWSKIGAASDAFFYESPKQSDTCAFACFNATVRDYARVGLMMLRGGTLGEKRVVSSAWVHDSTQPDAPYLKPKPGGPEGGYGYAYQWWVPPGHDDVFMALGIYGQCIYVNPARHIVIVQTSAWPEPVSDLLEAEQGAAFEKIAREIVP
ncbi:MAG TPA: serine hydrolase [Acidobacteriota bacterium]|nr:serine hydrolase [Acidobacteriota bacterium]